MDKIPAIEKLVEDMAKGLHAHYMVPPYVSWDEAIKYELYFLTDDARKQARILLSQDNLCWVEHFDEQDIDCIVNLKEYLEALNDK
jgi:hypothetical protein